MAAPKPKAAAARSTDAFDIVVIGPAKGRWRIGRHFGPGETRIPLADLTEAEIDALRADPALVVAGAASAANLEPVVADPVPQDPEPADPAAT